MGYLKEYIDKNMKPNDLFAELQNLTERYKDSTGRYLYLYVAAMSKRIPGISMEQDDFYIIRDMLQNLENEKEIDVYIETPGGRGETAEEIARFLHSKFDKVNFVISGEAKSAGTILVLSGNEVYMTETGSLGPIDAQIHIGRSIVSAYDYMDWVTMKSADAAKSGKLNPVDATMIAQITPGELHLVNHALEFAKDLVKEWLYLYKFNDWNETETRHETVTEEAKRKRAEEVAKELANHSRWRTHGRSLKIDDLRDIGLRVINLDENKEVADIIYRIQFVCKLLEESTSVYKLFFDRDEKILKQAVAANFNNTTPLPQGKPEAVQVEIDCGKCGRKHKFYKAISENGELDKQMQAQNIHKIPEDDSYKCECDNIIDLRSVKNELEMLLKKI